MGSIATLGGLTQTPAWNRSFNNPDADLLSTIVSIYEIGSAVGALVTFFIGERIGRKRTLSLGAIVMIVGAVLQASAFGTAQMIAARVISGVGMGLINSTAPVLQAEVSPKASRGRYVCAQLSTLNFGTMLSYWLDYGMTSRYDSAVSWRFPIAFQLVFIVPILVLSFIVTESPRWLEYHDRRDESRQVIAKLQGHASELKHPDVEERYREIADSVASEKAIEVSSFKSMFVNDRIGTRRRLLTAASVQFFQQLGGINAINYYAGFLFNTSIGFDVTTANLMGGVLFSWFFIASFIPWFLIDSWGRRPLLIGSVTFMACIFAVMSGLTHQIDINASNEHACAIAAVLMVFLYLGAFTTGFQATVWCYTPEILPLKIRAKGTALATFCNWIINFMVVKVFPIMIANIGWKTYVVFTIFNFSFLPVMYLFYVETKGRSLEEIDLIFEALHEGRQVKDVERETKCLSEHREKAAARM